ncbi:hypothetical protein NEFER03_0845 [Nematocida sp. LUAm3]|nr:hypothetical protein NEFER03_0845 [Nematocida sp. LUAm3]
MAHLLISSRKKYLAVYILILLIQQVEMTSEGSSSSQVSTSISSSSQAGENEAPVTNAEVVMAESSEEKGPDGKIHSRSKQMHAQTDPNREDYDEQLRNTVNPLNNGRNACGNGNCTSCSRGGQGCALDGVPRPVSPIGNRPDELNDNRDVNAMRRNEQERREHARLNGTRRNGLGHRRHGPHSGSGMGSSDGSRHHGARRHSRARPCVHKQNRQKENMRHNVR